MRHCNSYLLTSNVSSTFFFDKSFYPHTHKCNKLVSACATTCFWEMNATFEALNHFSHDQYCVWCRCMLSVITEVGHEASSAQLTALMLQRREASSDPGCVSFAPHVNTPDHWQA